MPSLLGKDENASQTNINMYFKCLPKIHTSKYLEKKGYTTMALRYTKYTVQT